jgi:hypothetical protein
VEVKIGMLWVAAGVLIGLQTTAFSARATREIRVGDRGDLTWLPPADMLNLASLVVTAVGVFVLPVLRIGSSALPREALGLGVVLAVGYPFGLAGHYDMYNRHTGRSNVLLHQAGAVGGLHRGGDRIGIRPRGDHSLVGTATEPSDPGATGSRPGTAHRLPMS